MSESPMWESFSKLSEIDEFELLATHEVRSEIFGLMMNNKHDSNMDDL
jgi:hypothetical protein